MNLPENDYQILKLTDTFYETYPNPPYVEILKKRKRAYSCILFQTHYDYYIHIERKFPIIMLIILNILSVQENIGQDWTIPKLLL